MYKHGDIPAARAIIQRCLIPNPDARPSVRELLQDPFFLGRAVPVEPEPEAEPEPAAEEFSTGSDREFESAGTLESWSEEEHAQDTIFKLSLEPADRKLLVDERVVYHDLVRIGDGSDTEFRPRLSAGQRSDPPPLRFSTASCKKRMKQPLTACESGCCDSRDRRYRGVARARERPHLRRLYGRGVGQEHVHAEARRPQRGERRRRGGEWGRGQRGGGGAAGVGERRGRGRGRRCREHPPKLPWAAWQSRLAVQGVFAQTEAAGGLAAQGSDQPEPAPQPAPAPAPAPASGGESPHGHSVTPKKVEAQVWGGFACPACTFENDASAQVCGMCETPRPQED